MTADAIMPPVHPGEILLTESLEPLEPSQYQLARSIGVPARRINEIVRGQRRISADTALRLAASSVLRSGGIADAAPELERPPPCSELGR